jgi:hypothetical protein
MQTMLDEISDDGVPQFFRPFFIYGSTHVPTLP